MPVSDWRFDLGFKVTTCTTGVWHALVTGLCEHVMQFSTFDERRTVKFDHKVPGTTAEAEHKTNAPPLAFKQVTAIGHKHQSLVEPLSPHG